MKFKVDQSRFPAKLSKLIYRAAIEAVGKRKMRLKEITWEHPASLDHGDYSSNIALRIKTKKFRTPWDLANAIVNAWRVQGLADWVTKVEVANPGFINVWLKNEVLISELGRVIKEKEKYGSSSVGKGKRMVIDYSSPNIAKSFGIGHLRSTIIGQAIYNLYRFLGWECIGDNHLGDWGTQFGKLIVAIKKWNQGTIRGLTVEKLEKLYVRFHQAAEKKPELEAKARLWFKKLEEKDPEARKIWRACVDLSLKEFKRIYDLLGVKIDQAYGESFYEDKTGAVIEEAKKKRVAVESEKALVIKLPELNIPPVLLLKSDGATTYAARDLACLAYRKKRWQPDLYVYEVGADQRLYFQQLFAAAEKLGYGQLDQFVHIPHGLIRLPTGKLSTRKGKTVYLEEVLEESIKRARKIMEDSETDRGLKKKEQEAVAQAVGIGAVKYFDLMHHHSTDIIFDWGKMFVLEGHSAPYLQYTHARCQSVLEKAEGKPKEINSDSKLTPEEQTLLRTIYKFPEVIVEAGENLAPNLVCHYLFDLAQKYNFFYHKQPILKAGNEELKNLRLALTLATAQILQNGLRLLGIETPEKM